MYFEDIGALKRGCSGQRESHQPTADKKQSGHFFSNVWAQGFAKGRDPNVPKPNRTPFNFFSADARPRAKAAFPELPQPEITKKVCAAATVLDCGSIWYQVINKDDK